MSRRHNILVVLLLIVFMESEAQVLAPAVKRSIETERRGIPSAVVEYSGTSSGDVMLRERAPVPFTGLGVGWTATVQGAGADEFSIEIRSMNSSGTWTEWSRLFGETAPEETPSGIYWGPLYSTPDGGRHIAYEIRVTAPESTGFTMLRTTMADASYGSGLPPPALPMERGSQADLKPAIIPRSSWWGNLPPDYLNPTNYTPQQIFITHAVVHHTAGTNNPTDPPQEIRNIWDFHVNGRGWSDIAYNFLIDQHGNIYQGRYNPYVDVIDVRGAHATYANAYSVGISLLGNFEIPDQYPNVLAVKSLEDVIAWRFDQRNLDPLSSAEMPYNDAGATVTLQRVSGHRDVSATACPGANLYAQLSTIRADVAMIIEQDGTGSGLPGIYALHQNYPNPFNPTTSVEFNLGQSGWVTIRVRDLLGRDLGTLTDRFYGAGNYTVTFDAGNLPAGSYFYTMLVNGHSETKKMVVVK